MSSVHISCTGYLDQKFSCFRHQLQATIPDPEDQKPEGYDDIKPTIPDPEASKPDDWDDDMDGEWVRFWASLS